MILAEISISGDALLTLVLNALILIVGGVLAYLVKKGHINAKTVEDTKEIANAMAVSIDKLKKMEPEAAKKLLQELIGEIGEKKQNLDAFLKSRNLNRPDDETTEPSG